MHNRLTFPYLIVVAVAALLVLIVWLAYRILPESAPVARGAAYAQIRSCIDCHGQPDNPATDSNNTDCSDINQMTWHPEYEVSCSDVLTYFETVRLRRNSKMPVQKNGDKTINAGELLARKYHCFNCHGPLGQGGFKNAKSFKGYVPGYFGRDFNILTRNGDPESVRQWIKYGMDPEILKNPITGPIAQYFFDRQAIRMPSFKSLDANEIDILVDYVIALNQYGAMSANAVRVYAKTVKQ